MMFSRVAMFAVCALVLGGCALLGPGTESGSPSVSPTAAPASAPGFTIEMHSRTDLQNYGQFTYMTATTKGLAPDAAARADERISGMVDAEVNHALAADDGACMEGEAKCGIFELTLAVLPCSGEFLCLKQDVNGAPVGSATSDQHVDVLVLDPVTGRAVDLSRFVPPEATERFLAAVNAEVADAQQQAGFYDPAYPTEVTEGDIAGWAPLADRIQIWFSRYSAGPGAMGAVTVSVPYPAEAPQSTSAAAPAVRDLAGFNEALYIICNSDMSTMPILRNESSDPWGASVAQTVLYVYGYYESALDGIYGPITRAAVKDFQRDAGIIVDGLVGPQTWGALQSAQCDGSQAGQPAAPPLPGSQGSGGDIDWGYWVQQLMATAEGGVWTTATVYCDVPTDWQKYEPYSCTSVDAWGARSISPMYIQISETGEDFSFTVGDRSYMASDYLS